jgi:hypothetical protein
MFYKSIAEPQEHYLQAELKYNLPNIYAYTVPIGVFPTKSVAITVKVQQL